MANKLWHEEVLGDWKELPLPLPKVEATNWNNEITIGHGRILQNKILSDVKFIVGKEKRVIEAHKIFLASASDVFERMFWTTHSPQYTITDIEPHIFEILLKYMYNQDIQYYLKPEPVDMLGDVFAILSAAKQYNLHNLVAKTNDSLRHCVTKDTALHVYKWATFYNHNLKETALQEICRSAHEILESKEFLRVDIEHLEKFIGLDALAAKDEMQIFEALIRWAEDQCKRGGGVVTPKYCRSYLEKVIPLIRFPQISESDFVSRVAFQGILSRDERGDMALYYKVLESNRSEVRLGDLQFDTKPRNYWKPNPPTAPAATLTLEPLRVNENVTSIIGANGVIKMK